MLSLLVLATAVGATPASPTSTVAAPAETQSHRWGASVAILSEQTALPSAAPVRVPLHLGAALGVVWTARPHARHLINLDSGISWFRHDPLFTSLTAAVSGGYRYQSPYRVGLEGRLGLGYIHSFATRPQYGPAPNRWTVFYAALFSCLA